MEISVFTLNVWGLPEPFSKEKSRRINAIGHFINTKDYDVVCFQELWCKADYYHLKELCGQAMPYSHYYYSGVFGSGLSIFSKWPILKTYFTVWSVNGYFHMVHHGDWFGGKGVALAQIIKNDVIINVYNTHLIAKYHDDDIYLTHRVIQAFDTGLFIDLTSSGADLTILCGDLNSSPQNICSRLIKSVAHLRDAYCANNTNGKEGCGTNECCFNSFAQKNGSIKNSKGHRIDYIFFKSNFNVKTSALFYDLPLSTRIPGTNFSYSDHEAVEVTLQASKDVIDDSCDKEVDSTDELLREAVEICSFGKREVKDSWSKYVMFTIIFAVLLIFFLNLSDNLHFLYYTLLLPPMVYFVFMSTIWYKLEINGITGAKMRIINFTSEHSKIKRLI